MASHVCKQKRTFRRKLDGVCLPGGVINIVKPRWPWWACVCCLIFHVIYDVDAYSVPFSTAEFLWKLLTILSTGYGCCDLAAYGRQEYSLLEDRALCAIGKAWINDILSCANSFMNAESFSVNERIGEAWVPLKLTGLPECARYVLGLYTFNSNSKALFFVLSFCFKSRSSASATSRCAVCLAPTSYPAETTNDVPLKLLRAISP